MRHFVIALLAFLLSAGALHAETLTLRDCLARTRVANPLLKVAGHEEKLAAESMVVASSGFLPRVDLQGGYTSLLEPQSIKFSTGSFPTQEPNFAYASLVINQTLYDFGRTGSRVRRAVLARDAAEHDYAAQEKDAFLQTVQAFYGILESRRVLRTAQEEIEQREEHLRVAQNLYEQGVVTRNDLLQAEVKLADSRQRQLEAANRVANGWLNLNFLMGQPPHYRAELEEVPEADEPVPVEGSDEQAFAGRRELASLRKAVQAGEAGVTEAKSNFYPELFARAGADFVQNKRVQEQAIYYATIGVRFNVFEGFAATARQRQAVLNRSAAEERVRLEEARIRLELQSARNDARVAAERVKTIGYSIRQGEENLRINRDRYSEQVGTATEVLDAQTLLTQVKTEYFRAMYARDVALARIRHALGQL